MLRSLLFCVAAGAFTAGVTGRLLMLGADETADRIGQWMAILGFALGALALVSALLLDRPPQQTTRNIPR